MGNICQYQTSCGGCPLGRLNSTEYESTMLKRFCAAFRANNVALPPVTFTAGAATGYRARLTLFNGGLKERHSNNIIPITNCPVASKEINDYLMNNPIDRRPRNRANVFGSCYATPAITVGAGDVTVTFKEELGAPQKRDTPIKNPFPKTSEASSLKKDNDGITTLTFPVTSFFQSNMEMLLKLATVLKSELHGDTLLDLYSGVGTFSAFLSGNFHHTTLIESNSDAAAYAYKNIGGILLFKYFAQRAADWVGGSYARNNTFNAAVVDPPRAGLGLTVAKYLADSKIPKIAYVSCNYATQARDVATLLSGGYTIKSARIFDFYHGTNDIESLVILEK